MLLPLRKEGFFIAQNPEKNESLSIINYTSIPEAVSAWKNDRQGKTVFHFLAEAYGISDVPKVLAETGMGEYLKYKQEGWFIGLIASQILKPNFYFLTNAVVLGELAKQGIPAALMVFEYPEDIFITRNHDKKDALGQIKFWLDGQNSIQVRVTPVGLKKNGFDMPIRTIDAASGHPCQNILIKAEQTIGPGNVPLSFEAAFGYQSEPNIPLTDFYRIMWQKSLERLNLNFPVFYVNMVRLYSAIAGASPVFNYQSRMLASADYYPLQVAWPDLYLECSSHASPDFLNAVSRAQQIRYAYGLPEVQVRIPHEFIPELEEFCLHPTGYWADLRPLLLPFNEPLRILAEKIKQSPKEERPDLAKTLKALQAERDSVLTQAMENHLQYNRQEPVQFPDRVAQFYREVVNV